MTATTRVRLAATKPQNNDVSVIGKNIEAAVDGNILTLRIEYWEMPA